MIPQGFTAPIPAQQFGIAAPATLTVANPTPPAPQQGRVPDQNYDGRRFRKAISRRWCDHRHHFELYSQQRPFGRFDIFPQNIPDEHRNLLPCFCYETAGTNINGKFIGHKSNKFRSATNALAWQPDSMRVITGDQRGNITMYNGLAFYYEFHLSAANNSIHDIIWTHSGDFLLTVDGTPSVKVWQSNYNSITEKQVARQAKIHQLTVSPNDRKFAMCSEDKTVKVWDLATLSEEMVYDGHEEEVRTCNWHPSQSLIASGGKDNLLRFFDPRENKTVNKVPFHRGFVTRCHWNPNGNYIASCGRDSMVYITDIRTMTPIGQCKGHENDVFAVQWHPTREDLLVSAGYKGNIFWWTIGVDEPVYALTKGHNKAIFQLKFNPMGSILASTGTEGVVKFWVRNSCGTDISKSSNIKTKEKIVQAKSVDAKDIPGLTSYKKLYNIEEEDEPVEEISEDSPKPESQTESEYDRYDNEEEEMDLTDQY
jgi:polyadenylation factor subunit 2